MLENALSISTEIPVLALVHIHIILQTGNDRLTLSHGGNTNFAIFAGDRDGTALTCYRPWRTACDRLVRLSTDKQTIKCDGKCANLVRVPTFWCLNRFLDSLLLF